MYRSCTVSAPYFFFAEKGACAPFESFRNATRKKIHGKWETLNEMQCCCLMARDASRQNLFRKDIQIRATNHKKIKGREFFRTVGGRWWLLSKVEKKKKKKNLKCFENCWHSFEKKERGKIKNWTFGTSYWVRCEAHVARRNFSPKNTFWVF